MPAGIATALLAAAIAALHARTASCMSGASFWPAAAALAAPAAAVDSRLDASAACSSPLRASRQTSPAFLASAAAWACASLTASMLVDCRAIHADSLSAGPGTPDRPLRGGG